MPRSIQEILDHADEIARRFEDYDPSDNDERPVAEYVLQGLVTTVCSGVPGLPGIALRALAYRLRCDRGATSRNETHTH